MSDDVFQHVGSLRKYYAGQAMLGLIANGSPDSTESTNNDPDKLAKRAFEIADAMVRLAMVGDKKPTPQAH